MLVQTNGTCTGGGIERRSPETAGLSPEESLYFGRFDNVFHPRHYGVRFLDLSPVPQRLGEDRTSERVGVGNPERSAIDPVSFLDERLGSAIHVIP